jgi:hypothetical protein
MRANHYSLPAQRFRRSTTLGNAGSVLCRPRRPSGLPRAVHDLMDDWPEPAELLLCEIPVPFQMEAIRLTPASAWFPGKDPLWN